jgi:hypothetical protein
MDQEKIFFFKLEVGFLGADVYCPLGLTGVRITNFFIYSNFSVIFYRDFIILPRNEIYTKKFT